MRPKGLPANRRALPPAAACRLVSLALLSALIAACGGAEAKRGGTTSTGGTMTGGGMGGMMMGSSMGGGGMLGGSAMAEVLVRRQLPGPPPGPAAWAAYRFRLAPGEILRQRHPFSIVYAKKGRQLLDSGSKTTRLAPGSGAAVLAGASHAHRAPSARAAVFWDVLLAPPAATAPPGAKRVFESPTLKGVPARPTAAFARVSLPPRGGRTTVHSHPGPELIYVTRGRFAYQNALIGTRRVGPGAIEAIPPYTAVQKRNFAGRRASFLAWFLLAPGKPFASPTMFMGGS